VHADVSRLYLVRGDWVISGEGGHALLRTPALEIHRRPRIGPPRVRVADVGGEEFQEAQLAPLPHLLDGGRDKGCSCDDFVHTQPFLQK